MIEFRMRRSPMNVYTKTRENGGGSGGLSNEGIGLAAVN
jgi:hypothetical protein